jgi:hypothetical protein
MMFWTKFNDLSYFCSIYNQCTICSKYTYKYSINKNNAVTLIDLDYLAVLLAKERFKIIWMLKINMAAIKWNRKMMQNKYKFCISYCEN